MTSANDPSSPTTGELYARALDATRRFIAGIAPEQWELPTPCDEWNLRELVGHVMYGTVWIEDAFGGKTMEEVGDKYDGDLIGDDTLAAYDAAVASAKRGLSQPGAMEMYCHLSRGDVLGSDYARSMFTDVFIHGWDIAKATGQDTGLDAELVVALWALTEPRRERMMSSPAFGAGKVPEPPALADLQTRLLAILGREA